MVVIEITARRTLLCSTILVYYIYNGSLSVSFSALPVIDSLENATFLYSNFLLCNSCVRHRIVKPTKIRIAIGKMSISTLQMHFIGNGCGYAIVQKCAHSEHHTKARGTAEGSAIG